MAYRTKGGRLVRTGKPVLTLYHFTPPPNLPSIIENGIYPSVKEKYDHMLPGSVAVWLTSNPHGNQITEANLVWWRQWGFLDLIAEHAAGRKFVFGYNAAGSARITVQLPEKFERLFHYESLLTANYHVTAPKSLAYIVGMPGVADWWVVPSPADGETFLGIGPGAITDVNPVGDPSPEYLAAIEQITAECERAA
jgi:hypothetical protein